MKISRRFHKLFQSASLKAVGVLLAILVTLNLGICFNAKKSQRGKLLATVDALPGEIDCLFLGNSLVEAGCDMRTFRESWPEGKAGVFPTNIALGATSPVEHALILKRALRRPVRLKYLIYGFFDDQLNAMPRGDWSDLVGNRALSYYFPSEAARLYAPGSWAKRWQLFVVGHIPMLAERSALWSKVELLRRRFEEVGMPKHLTTRYGRVDDFSALESADVDSFVERCEKVVRERRGLSPAVEQILELGRSKGAKVILVEMPMPSRHRTRFYAQPAWQRLRSYLRTLALQHSAVYIQASDWIPDDRAFEDATHLNEEGAKKFSRLLAVAVADENTLEAASQAASATSP